MVVTSEALSAARGGYRTYGSPSTKSVVIWSRPFYSLSSCYGCVVAVNVCIVVTAVVATYYKNTPRQLLIYHTLEPSPARGRTTHLSRGFRACRCPTSTQSDTQTTAILSGANWSVAHCSAVGLQRVMITRDQRSLQTPSQFLTILWTHNRSRCSKMEHRG